MDGSERPRVDELTVARMRTELAISVVGLFSDMAPDHADRVAIIDDMVACWLAFPEAVREYYRTNEYPNVPALAMFGAEYTAVIDREVATAHPNLSGPAYEEIMVRRWREHVLDTKSRQAADLPPLTEFLAQFPCVEEFAGA